MKRFSTILLVMFMIMYFIFRILVTVQTELGGSFLEVTSLDIKMDIILLFVSLVCIILVVKRNLIGALIYLLGYGMYLGPDMVIKMQSILNGGSIDIGTAMTVFTGIICLLLAIFIVIDILIDEKQKLNPKDKKTDWFFKNEQFDRKYDKRADKNHYKDM